MSCLVSEHSLLSLNYTKHSLFLLRRLSYLEQVYVRYTHSNTRTNTLEKLKRFGAGKGSWAVVTGASDGIGKEFAFQLAKTGFNIVLVARNEDLLKETATQIGAYLSIYIFLLNLIRSVEKKYPGTATIVHLIDFSKNDHEGFATFKSQFSELDIGVLGKSTHYACLDVVAEQYCSEQCWQITFDANRFRRYTRTRDSRHRDYQHQLDSRSNLHCIAWNVATVSSTSLFMFHVSHQSRKRGLILNIGSFAGAIPSPMLATYSGTKAFLATFSSALAEEVKSSNVMVQHLNTYFVVSFILRGHSLQLIISAGIKTVQDPKVIRTDPTTVSVCPLCALQDRT